MEESRLCAVGVRIIPTLSLSLLLVREKVYLNYVLVQVKRTPIYPDHMKLKIKTVLSFTWISLALEVFEHISTHTVDYYEIHTHNVEIQSSRSRSHYSSDRWCVYSKCVRLTNKIKTNINGIQVLIRTLNNGFVYKATHSYDIQNIQKR